MKIVTGTRVGQSGPELFPAVLFSSVLHVLVFTGAFILFGLSSPRTFVPPYYRVTLVDQPAGALPPLAETAAPEPQKQAEAAPQKKAPAKKS